MTADLAAFWAEWSSYRPADFLMFAPDTYWRLFELHNQAWWPAPLLLPLAGAAVLLAPGRGAPRSAAALLAVTWAFAAAAFLLHRYAPINWAATRFAAGFALQAAVLAAVALRPAPAAPRPAPGLRRSAGSLLVGLALFAYPLLAPISGRAWAQAEVFALAPDPTAIATLGWLLRSGTPPPGARWLRGAAWALALAWCAVSAATLWTLGSAQGWVPALAAVAAIAVLASRRG